MSSIDFIIFSVYMLGIVALGAYFFRKNSSTEDYFVGGRKMGPWHVGMSVVATDVGGGFSIGLGGLGYTMGLTGSWMLFTGLLGAWLSAVFIIPRIKRIDAQEGMLTFPDFLRHRYGGKVALLAALVSGVGYAGFTGAQALAGAKLASSTILREYTQIAGMDSIDFALLAIAVVIVLYTMLGGIKAVIYTDTVQWIVLLSGLIFLAVPFSLHAVGGLEGLRATLPPSFFGLFAFESWQQPLNWFVTIVPIWLIGMTLYQRIYAVNGPKNARKAWFIAGLFEWPIMAFTGVFLGLCSRALFPAVDPEMGLPLLIESVLPIGVTGIVVASYFSAIMSTADSCLMASSGNLVNDVLQRSHWGRRLSTRAMVYLSMAATGLIGVLAVAIAQQFEQVLDAMLYAYGFMVGGLFVPTLAAYFWPRATPRAALLAIIAGGGSTITLQLLSLSEHPPGWLSWLQALGLDPVVYGLFLSALTLVVSTLARRDTQPA